MEDYVTFEQALRLKELGFDWYNRYTQMYYATQCYCEGNNPIYFDTIGTGDLISSPKMKEDENDGWIEDEDYSVLAPTMSQAAKWLREVKGIYVEISRYQLNNFAYELKFDYYSNHRYCCQGFMTPEKALIRGIDEALELLK